MPVPLVLLAGIAAGAAINIAVGYVVEEHTPIGDGNYTARDATIDGAFGALGVGGVFKTANYGRKAYKYKKAADRAEAAGDATLALRVGIRHNDDVLVSGVRIMQQDATIRAGLHGGATVASEILKGRDSSTPGSSPGVSGGPRGTRPIKVLDPIVNAALMLSPDINRVSRVTTVRPTRTSRKRSSRKSSRRCRCKDGSYSVKCC